MQREIITGLPLITNFQFEGRTNADLHRAKAKSKRLQQEEQRRKLLENRMPTNRLIFSEAVVLESGEERIIFKN